MIEIVILLLDNYVAFNLTRALEEKIAIIDFTAIRNIIAAAIKTIKMNAQQSKL